MEGFKSFGFKSQLLKISPFESINGFILEIKGNENYGKKSTIRLL